MTFCTLTLLNSERCKSCWNVSLARLTFSLHFGVFLEPSKRDGMTFSKYSNPLSNNLTGSEWVEWFFGDNVINLVAIESKGVNHLWKQISTLLRLFLRMPKSPLLIAMCTIHPSSTGNHNGGRETGKLKPDIADGIYVNFQQNPHICCIGQYSGTNVSPGWCQGEWTIKNGGLEP